MSQFVIYITLEKYLAEWAHHSLGSPIVFPAQSNENAIIRTFIQKLPKGTIPIMNDGNMTAISIPDSKAKPAREYNYIGVRGQKAIRECIKDLFKRNLWNEIGCLSDSGVGVNALICAWCEMHGIDIDRMETVRQAFYRMREAYTKKGINLRNFSREKSRQEEHNLYKPHKPAQTCTNTNNHY
ncbi:MAG: hypothetical protein RSA66_09235 [Muribaculaceae bacterium]